MPLPDLFRYTRWANDAVLSTLREAGDSTEATVEGLPEAQRLMSHLVRAQAIWLGRVEDSGDATLALWTTDSLDACARRSDETIGAWLNLVGDSDALERPVTYRNSSGAEFTNALHVIAHHVVNHGTHHRAQIARVLRTAGHAPAATDYIFYARG